MQTIFPALASEIGAQETKLSHTPEFTAPDNTRLFPMGDIDLTAISKPVLSPNLLIPAGDIVPETSHNMSPAVLRSSSPVDHGICFSASTADRNLMLKDRGTASTSEERHMVKRVASLNSSCS